MARLLKYELKKMLKRPFSLVVLLGSVLVLAFASLYVPLMDARSFAWGPDVYGSTEAIPQWEKERAAGYWGAGMEGVLVRKGLEAIALDKENSAPLAGQWNEAKLAELREGYFAFRNNPDIYTDELDEFAMMQRGWNLEEAGMSQAELEAYNEANPIYTMKPEYQFGEWNVWGQLSELFESGGRGLRPDGSPASFAEVFPQVQAPAQYEYIGGVEQAAGMQNSLVGLLALALLLAAVAPLFSEEVACHTEAMLLAARHGRGKLVYAKLLAGLLLTVGGLVLFTLLNLLMYGCAYGFGGYSVPVQFSVMQSTFPYTASFGQYMLLQFGVQLLSLCALAAVLMLLSALLRSSLPVLFLGGVFSIVMLFTASLAEPPYNYIAQLLPGANAIPTGVLQNGTVPGLGHLPLPQLPLALLAAGLILLVAATAVVLHYRRLQKK